ncbi:hypothetical protein HY212_04150 [Candidatus Pacearchaeota archaeon]|nr:hypothetical protein [Candidatus Pacearchaeota archaeon]
MNKKAQNSFSLNASRWSASAVSVGVAGFMAFTGHGWWAFGFIILAIVIAIIPYL